MSHLSEEQLDQLVAAERAREHEPLNDWRTIAARAREEGLIHDREWRGSSGQPWLQAAAAVLLLVGGIAIGRTTIGLPTVPQNQAVAPTPANSDVAISNTAPTVTPTSNTSINFGSVDEASAALDRAVQEYQRASQYIAANNLAERTRDSAAIYRARAEALDQIANAARSALATAPHDPIINQYYLATMGARVATRQVVSTAGLRGF
ncbi:MAG TPA: hypothetical protein VJ840_15875 [Gemmatimonadaceae bacterium]|nr:hypothetical protein [Gemmatimonadaceae bacterium]